jgi:hypothetical protein
VWGRGCIAPCIPNVLIVCLLLCVMYKVHKMCIKLCILHNNIHYLKQSRYDRSKNKCWYDGLYFVCSLHTFVYILCALFLTSPLYGDERSVSRLSGFTLGRQSWYKLGWRIYGHPSCVRSCGKEKGLFPLPRIDLQFLVPEAHIEISILTGLSRLRVWAIVCD